MAETGCAKTEVTASKQMVTNISVSMMDLSLSKASSWRYQQQLIDVEIKSLVTLLVIGGVLVSPLFIRKRLV